MFKFLFNSNTKHAEVEEAAQPDDDNCSETDSTSSINLTDYILGSPYYTKHVFESTTLEKYICDFRKLIPNIHNWAYNRKVDAEHVDCIYRNLKSMTFPHLMGSIKVVRDKATNSLTLLDGQHRILALKKYMEDADNVAIDIEVDVYHVEDITKNDIEIQDFFVKANNNKNVAIADIPETKVIDIIDKMIEIWPRNIKTREDQGAYKPNITKRDLYNAMKDHYKASPTLHSKTPSQILKSIVNINAQLRMKPLKELFGREAPSKKKIFAYEKAIKHGFFLNLDCKYDLSVWMKMLA